MKKNILKYGLIALMLGSVSTLACATHAVLLVSLGMPDNTLIAYLTQAKRAAIPVVIRGLYTSKPHRLNDPAIGRFSDTARRVNTLVHHRHTGGVSINPLLFRAFTIKTVPALVIYNDALPCIEKTTHAPFVACQDTQFDVVFGNVPIETLLTIVARRSPSAARAHFANALILHAKKEGNGA